MKMPESLKKSRNMKRPMPKLVEAVKLDQGKRMTIAPIRARMEIEKVATYGTKKYALGNWHAGKSFNYGRLLDAGHRHIDEFELGNNLDEESGLHHLAHASWCFMVVLELLMTGHGEDDRHVRQYLPNMAKVPFKVLP